jgi:hypothetical protein
MSCHDYCSGPLVVKLYQLMGQGSRTLCEFSLFYAKNNECMVTLDGQTQALNRAALTTIALTHSTKTFYKLFTPDFRYALKTCPSKINQNGPMML